MSDFKDRLHLVEMLDAIGEIEMDTGGLSEDAWVEVGSLVRAVSMSLITLGEGAAQLSDALKESAPDVPWRRMIGLRNRLAHAYFRADRHIIWQAATQHTPIIKEQLQRLLAALPDS